MKRAILLAACAALLSGCMASNLTEFAKALGQDPATVCFQLTTIYGQGKLSRTNCTNCDVSCTAEGMAIKSTSPSTSLPVTIQAPPAQKAN